MKTCLVYFHRYLNILWIMSENIQPCCVISIVTSSFTLFDRGKGDYFRLGHGTDAHVRKPQVVEGLKGKKIVHVAVGALHCLAVTDNGQVRWHTCITLILSDSFVWHAK